MTKAIAACLLGLVAAASPAVAEHPLSPGFWSYPTEPGKPADEIAASCRTGFTLMIDGTHRMSFLLEDGRFYNDFIESCTFDAPSGKEVCTGKGWDGKAFVETVLEGVYSRDEAGVLKMVSTVEGAEDHVTFPTQCPPGSVIDALGSALSPER
jgi:hypothetical protein